MTEEEKLLSKSGFKGPAAKNAPLQRWWTVEHRKTSTVKPMQKLAGYECSKNNTKKKISDYTVSRSETPRLS